MVELGPTLSTTRYRQQLQVSRSDAFFLLSRYMSWSNLVIIPFPVAADTVSFIHSCKHRTASLLLI